MVERLVKGLYVLAIAIVASTLIFSYAMTSSAGAVAGALEKASASGVKLGTGLAVAAGGVGPAAPVASVAPSVAASPTAGPTATAQPAQVPQDPTPSGILTSGYPVKGSESAKLLLVEYSDFQCPYCSRFVSQTLPSLDDNYLKTGKVKMIFKNFPLPGHPLAKPAAIAAECARAQGKFWEMHDKLFANQGSLSDANYKQWARDIGLDGTAFDACVADKDGSVAAAVGADLQEGVAQGVQGTPSFILLDAGGNRLEGIRGAQPFEVFKSAIDPHLS